ncbi:MAG: hypothetical protein LLF92_05635 [Planctomycetaceae bacterium]|nr:hypothetical protein [Planctomycetaceae bacterium]
MKGAINRFFFTPAIITNNHFVSVESTKNPDEQRVKFIFAYQSKQGFYGLKKTNITIEGEPIVFYAATKNGVLSMFVDYTMVEYSPRKFVEKKVDNVVFEPADSNNPASKSKSNLKFSLQSGELKKM